MARSLVSQFHPRLNSLDDRITPALLSFEQPQVHPLDTAAYFATTGDFNADGLPDLVDYDIVGTAILISLNTTPVGAPATSFAPATRFTPGGSPYPWAFVVADLNADGRNDLAWTNDTFGSYSLTLMLNTSSVGAAVPTFAAPQTFATGGQFWYDLRAGDLNGDGRPDLVGSSSGTSSSGVGVLLNTTTPGATSASFGGVQTPLSRAQYVSNLAVADFNGDGRADLAVNQSALYGITVMLNATPAGSAYLSFNSSESIPSPTYSSDLLVADFNADGRPDLATVGERFDLLSVWVNRSDVGGLSTSFASHQSFPIPRHPSGYDPLGGVGVGDFDGDGRPDVVYALGVSSFVGVALNTTPPFAAAPTFAAPQTFAVASPGGFAVADFNADGRPDVATHSRRSNDGDVSILTNTTAGTATAAPALVGQFGDAGVWGFHRDTGTWNQMTASNANALAAAPNGNVVAAFGGSGVWYYQPTTGWYLINGNPATAVGTDRYGNAVASFPGFGTAVYRLATGWTLLTGVPAAVLAVNGDGDVAASFAGYGTYRFDVTAGWQLLTGINAQALAIGETGDVVASFRGYGVNRYRQGSGWARLNGVDATAVAIDGSGAVTANFLGYGVGQYVPYAGGWRTLTGNSSAVSLAVDWFGGVSAAFAGAGVYEYHPAYGWRQRTASVANLIDLG